MLVKPEQLLNPFYSFMLTGPFKSGKTQSIASLYWWHRQRVRRGIKLPDGTPMEAPTQLWVFDLDRDGAEPLRRIAINGTDTNVKPAIPGGWLDDLKIYRYAPRGDYGKIKMQPTVGGTSQAVDSPRRSSQIFDQLCGEFNSLWDMLDPKTGYWKEPVSAPAIIAIDGATRLEEIITDFIASVRSRELNSVDAGERARFADWGAIKDKEVEFIDSAINLPCHFVYCVHDELREEQVQASPTINPNTGAETPRTIGTGRLLIVPALVGQLRDTMGGKFTAVLWTRCENNKYYWLIAPQQEGAAQVRGAGTRTKDGLPAKIDQDFRLILP